MNTIDLESLRHSTSQSSTARRRAQRLPQTVRTPVAGSFQHLCDRVFIIRESDEYAYMLVEKMLEQTLHPYAGCVSVDTALRTGALVLRRTKDGLAAREALNVRVLMSSKGPRKELGVLYQVEDDWFLLCLATAGKKTLEGDNEFTTVLAEILAELRPAEIIAGPFGRLARTGHNASIIADKVRANRTIVRTLEVPAGMNLTDAGGKAQWEALQNAAEWDYRLTLTRLLTGVVFDLKNNRYPRSTLPYGYEKVVTAEGVAEVAVKDSDRHIVRRIIELAASDMSLRGVADELAKLGLKSRQPGQVKQNRTVPVNEVADPETLVRQLFRVLPTYRDGKYRFTHEMTLENVDEFHGLTVHRVAPTDNGYIQVDLDFGLPEGGWHDGELIDDAIRRRLLTGSEPTPTPTSKQEMKPLASLARWCDGDHEYFLHSHDSSYTLRRRPDADAFDGDGTMRGFGHSEGELVGNFPAEHLHHAIADGLEQLAQGLPTTEACPLTPPPSAAEVSQSRTSIEEAAKAAAAARSELVHATSEEAKQHFRDLAESFQEEADRMSSELRRLRVRPARLQLDVDEVGAAIALLRSTQEKAPVQLNRALHRLISSLRIHGAACDPVARVTFNIEVRANHGALRAGPVEVVVCNQAVGVSPKEAGWQQAFMDRNRRIVEVMLLDEGDDDDRRAIVAGEKFDDRAFVRRMHEALADVVPTAAARSALIDCPIVDLRRAVLGPMLGLQLNHALPPELAAGAAAIYNDDRFSWPNGWCPGGMTRMRQVLGYVEQFAESEDDGVPFTEVRDAIGLTDAALYAYIGGKTRSSTPSYPILEDVDDWYTNGSRKRNQRRGIRLRRCPKCGERRLNQPLKVPEVPGHLICTACHHDPVAQWSYPSDYLLAWDGPQTHPRRRDSNRNEKNRYSPSRDGRIIVGADIYGVEIPSRFTPRRQE